MFLGRLRATHVGKQWVAQGSEIGADVLTVSFELEPASHSPSFVLFSPLALFATMQAQSPSRHSHKSSKASGSSKGTKRARKTGSHPEKTGSHPEKANKDLTMVASEPTGAMSSEGASALEAKKNERSVVCQESLSQAPAESPTKKRKACTFLCGSVSFQSPDPVNPERDSIRLGL